MKQFVIERRSICDKCDKQKVVFGVKTCSECGCSIWAKSMLANAECPLHKWKQIDDNEN